MTAKVLNLEGKRVETPSDGETPRDVLLKLLAEIDAGKPVERIACVLLVDDAKDAGLCYYESRASDMTLNESHMLHSIGAAMKMDLLLGRS